MRSKALLILNPCAGVKRANRYLTDIIGILESGGYSCGVSVTAAPSDAETTAMQLSAFYDLVVAIGGDGTLNEVISGVLRSRSDVPIGYIPAGTTNDLANSLGLSRDILHAARDIIEGEPVPLDVGSFNGRYFVYTASFGIFTKASYTTPQAIKNSLGHLAYILEGVRALPLLSPITLEFDIGDNHFTNDYIFGAVSNSTSIGGILTISPELVSMNDGKFELLLIEAPKNGTQFSQIILALTSRQYDHPLIRFLEADRITIKAPTNVEWTLDGEYEPGSESIEIKNHHGAVSIITKP